MKVSFVVFTREEDGRPKVVTTLQNLPLERKGMDFLGIALMPYQARPDGLPAEGELSKVGKIEDQITTELEAKGAVHLGRIIHNGAIRAAYVARYPCLEEVAVKTGLFGKTKFRIEWRQDPGWAWYAFEMEPTPVEFEIGTSQQLFQALRERGDRHEKPRPVDFAARFPTAAGRAAFLEAVAGEGYKVTEKGMWEPAPGDFWCETNLVTDVREQTIGRRCAYLREQARAQNGDFDGWGCPIEV